MTRVDAQRATRNGDDHMLDIARRVGARECITSSTHPLIWDALERVSHDCGMGAGHERYWIPDRWSKLLADFERGLALLETESERTAFCLGDPATTRKVSPRHSVLKEIQKFLDDFFNDWGVNEND